MITSRDTDRAPGHARRDDALSGDVGHGEPPSWERPGGPLARASDPPDDVVSVGDVRLEVEVQQDVGEGALETIGRHTTCPPVNAARIGAVSAAVVARIAASE